MDYEKNKRYFKKVSYGGAIILTLIGIIIFFACVSTSNGDIAIIGLLLIAGGIGLIYLKIKSKVSDEEYDASVLSMISNIKSKALEKLGLEEEELITEDKEPVSIFGYDYKNATKIKEGNDKIYRSDKFEIIMLFFTQQEAHIYTYKFDTTEPKQTEATDVYFYKDIVSVSTASDSIQSLGYNINYEYFKLTTAGGTALSVSLRDTNDAQNKIKAMRSILREKKQG